MRVSIVIPCFRQAHFLRTAIDSALSQTHSNVEVIVVNDGSDDDTERVVASYGSAVRYVSQTNQGLSAARNAGIAVATGNYFLFHDSDDALSPFAVEWMLSGVTDPSRSIVVVGAYSFETTPEEATPFVMPTLQADQLRQLIPANLAPPICYLVPATLIRNIGGFERDLRSCEDWDCWIRLILNGGILSVVPKYGAFYRNTPDSMSKNLSRMLISRAQVLLRLHKALREKSLLFTYGNILLDIEVQILRRMLAQRVSTGRIRSELSSCVRELEALGFKLNSSWKQRTLKRLLGRFSEPAMVIWYRFQDPQYFQYLLNGYT